MHTNSTELVWKGHTHVFFIVPGSRGGSISSPAVLETKMAPNIHHNCIAKICHEAAFHGWGRYLPALCLSF